ncbi:hypothetical protein MUK51_21080 [Sphingobacterium faecium]|uniref:hypothetical protein n=1 Tax=Sphingobacterium faecium TaxID=34087 RepID=UPI0004E5FC57|nr:hypothetical protein [Sphingobacterium faecium]UXD69656.1 hypothetical protein MUK51_21080 [Sphingobacterium faecium]CDT00238.1 conserved exported hypothetical protein [Sphingobacterium sp. PM2-P1-29]
MKKNAQFNLSISSLLFIFLLAAASSCQKNKKISDELEENVFAVKFKIKDFESIVTPLQKASGVKKLASGKATGSSQEEILFQWTFDLGNTDPTIAINPLPIIDYNNGKVDYSFTAGWPTTGKSINFRGAQSILLKLPVQRITLIQSLSMDVNSSGTGPRALLIDYSTDRGLSFSKLSDTIHYPIELANTGVAKLPVTQSLTAIPVFGKEYIWIRLRLFEGTRPTGSMYNPTTGTFKMDNLMITGITDESVLQNKLYYHIYNSESQALVKQGGISAQESFEIDLPVGTYYLSLVTKNSNSPIFFANSANRSGFYMSNSFLEKEVEIYASRDTFEVSNAMERVLTLDRIFSEINVEFTDVEDLSKIDSIRIQQKHPSFYYYPFSNSSNTQMDASVLLIEPNFTANNKKFYFNQFMGFHDTNRSIKYELKVFAEGVPIRTFELSTDIKNNMQVLFKGLLLEGFDPIQGFTIRKNETWNGRVDVDF